MEFLFGNATVKKLPSAKKAPTKPTKLAEREASDLGLAIGIDLGTTFSCVAVMIDGKVHVCPDEDGRRTMPSYVSFAQEAPFQPQLFVGHEAKQLAKTNPIHTVFDSKRLIGRQFSDATCQADMKLLPYSVVQADGDKPSIQVRVNGKEREYPPEEIAAMVLSKMKRVAKDYLEELGTHKSQGALNAVITVPAYFNDMQREMTQNAGRTTKERTTRACSLARPHVCRLRASVLSLLSPLRLGVAVCQSWQG